ncbi:MAG: sortase-associated OmpA-like protein PdsO [Gammaproteobacteria bacterium]
MNGKTFKWIAASAAMVVAQIAHGASPDSETGGNLGVGGGAAIGALVAGPAGAIIGAGVGGFLGERLQVAASVDTLETSLYQSRADAEDLRSVLSAEREQLLRMREDRSRLDQRITDLEDRQSLAADLQLAVLFRTGSSELDSDALARIDRLAELMAHDPALSVHLDGYADPRGDVDYNMSLSESRAQRVREALTDRGVPAAQVQTQAHGMNFSSASEGDLDAYALERRVNIKLHLGQGPRVAARED